MPYQTRVLPEHGDECASNLHECQYANYCSLHAKLVPINLCQLRGWVFPDPLSMNKSAHCRDLSPMTRNSEA